MIEPQRMPDAPGYWWRWCLWLGKWEPVGVWQDGDEIWREEMTCRRIYPGHFLPLTEPPEPVIESDRVWQI